MNAVLKKIDHKFLFSSCVNDIYLLTEMFHLMITKKICLLILANTQRSLGNDFINDIVSNVLT